jgi:hypothetical protein
VGSETGGIGLISSVSLAWADAELAVTAAVGSCGASITSMTWVSVGRILAFVMVEPTGSLRLVMGLVDVVRSVETGLGR